MHFQHLTDHFTSREGIQRVLPRQQRTLFVLRNYFPAYPTTEHNPCNTDARVCGDIAPNVLTMLLSDRVKILSNLIQQALGSAPCAR